MSDLAIGLTGLGVMFGLMIFRTPVAFAMLLVGFFCMWALDGFRTAGGVLLTESTAAVSNYALIVVPMFILLGNVSSAAGFSRGF